VDDLQTHKKVYFAGDTGYRTVRDGEDEDKVPVCPAFAEVGECFGGVDVALLPIGYVMTDFFYHIDTYFYFWLIDVV
jgi:L-ascorbate metabolism protein UlaG (beta-lactamase superfamily)